MILPSRNSLNGSSALRLPERFGFPAWSPEELLFNVAPHENAANNFLTVLLLCCVISAM
jgi:hypothetical protein